MDFSTTPKLTRRLGFPILRGPMHATMAVALDINLFWHITALSWLVSQFDEGL